MGSDPLLTVFEAKIVCFFASTAVMKGSDPIKSTAARIPDHVMHTGDRSTRAT